MFRIRNEFLIIVARRISSYQCRKPGVPDSWELGVCDNHSAEDTLTLYNKTQTLYRIPRIQTVSNIPGGRFKDTVAPGKFYLVWRVDPRQHRGPVHGIVEALDLDGQKIDKDSIERVAGKDGAPIDFNRWLMHDDQKLTTSPEGRTRIPWSAGCFVSCTELHGAFTWAGDNAGFQAGDWIPTKLIEVPQ